jgi:membrane protein required for colicin V production
MVSSGLPDALIAAFLILQTFLGWRRGLLWQMAGFASTTLGVLLGWVLAPSLGPFVNKHISSNNLHARLVAFLFVLGTVGLVTRLLAAWAQVHAERGLGKKDRELRRAEDRILGGIFGALKGCVLALIMVAATASYFPKSGVWTHSMLAGPFARAGAWLLPEGATKDMAQWANRSVADIRDELDAK